MCIEKLLAAAALLTAIPSAGFAQAEAGRWNRTASKLRGVSETFKKWGFTVEVKQDVFAAHPDFCPSKFSVSGTMESPDSVKMDVEVELGRREAAAIGISGSYKVDPNGKSISGKGTMLVKGSGASYEFSYNSIDGFTFETGLEETFYSIGVKVGGDGLSPLNLGLKLGPATIKLDPVKYVRRMIEVGPELARTAKTKVGGVLLRTDIEFLAAALAKAPPPSTLELRNVTCVSLKRLLPLAEKNRSSALGPLTTVFGVVLDSAHSDVILIGRDEPGMPKIPLSVLSALLRSVWRDGLEPFVSLDPAPGVTELRLKPRVGGLSEGLTRSQLVLSMLTADYRMKSALYGDIVVPNLVSIPDALAKIDTDGRTGSARFWFMPRPLRDGDIGVVRGKSGTVLTIHTQPMILTENTAGSVNKFASDASTKDPVEAVLQRAALQLTRAYSELERTHPGLGFKELRHCFETASITAILRREKASPACTDLLRKIAALPIIDCAFPQEFIPVRRSFPSRNSSALGQIWGGANTGTSNVSSARLQVDESLLTALKGIQHASWRNGSATVYGVFEPVIANAKTVSLTEMAAPHVSVAERYLAQRSIPQALGELNQALQLDPNNSQAYLLRAKVKYLGGNYDGVIADASQAIRIAPKDATGYMVRAYGELDSNRMEAANSDLDTAIRLSPGFSEPYVLRGLMLLRESPTAAVAQFDKALKTAPVSTGIYALRGEANKRLGKLDEASADFDKAIGADPRNVGAYRQRALLRTKREDFKGALADRQKIVDLKPTGEHYADLAVAMLDMEDFVGAVASASRCAELNPHISRGYHLRGLAKMRLKDYAGALPDLEAALVREALPYLRKVFQEEIDECRSKLNESAIPQY